MLQDLLKGLVLWLYSLILEGIEYLASALMEVFDMDLAYFETHAPVIGDIANITLAAGWALLTGNLVFQATRSMASGLGFEGEDPKILFARTFVFSFLLVASRQICDTGLSLTGNVMDLLGLPDAVVINTPEESHFGFFDASWLLMVIVGLILIFQVIKFFFEIAERYVVIAVLTFMAPLAFGMGGSKSTEDIFKGWARMYGSMCVMMLMNVIFLKLLLSAMSTIPSGAGILPWLLFIVAIARVARKIDDLVCRIGLNPARTGDPLGRGMPLALTIAAARKLASTMGKGGSGGPWGGAWGGFRPWPWWGSSSGPQPGPASGGGPGGPVPVPGSGSSGQSPGQSQQKGIPPAAPQTGGSPQPPGKGPFTGGSSPTSQQSGFKGSGSEPRQRKRPEVPELGRSGPAAPAAPPPSRPPLRRNKINALQGQPSDDPAGTAQSSTVGSQSASRHTQIGQESCVPGRVSREEPPAASPAPGAQGTRARQKGAGPMEQRPARPTGHGTAPAPSQRPGFSRNMLPQSAPQGTGVPANAHRNSAAPSVGMEGSGTSQPASQCPASAGRSAPSAPSDGTNRNARQVPPHDRPFGDRPPSGRNQPSQQAPTAPQGAMQSPRSNRTPPVSQAPVSSKGGPAPHRNESSNRTAQRPPLNREREAEK